MCFLCWEAWQAERRSPTQHDESAGRVCLFPFYIGALGHLQGIFASGISHVIVFCLKVSHTKPECHQNYKYCTYLKIL